MLLSYQYLCIISKYYIILITILYNTDYDIISKYEKWNIKTDYENQRKTTKFFEVTTYIIFV